MPIKKGKGGKKRRKGKKTGDNENKKELLLKDDGQEYGQVTKLLGSCRFSLLCADGKERLAILRGKMRKRQWIRMGSFVIVGIREFEDGKCDIIHVYQDTQTIKIRKFFAVTDEKADKYMDQNSGIVFGNESDEDIEPFAPIPQNKPAIVTDSDDSEFGEIDIAAI